MLFNCEVAGYEIDELGAKAEMDASQLHACSPSKLESFPL